MKRPRTSAYPKLRRPSRRGRLLTAAVTATVLVLGLGQVPAQAAPLAGEQRPEPAPVDSVTVEPVQSRTSQPGQRTTETSPTAAAAPAPVWPRAADAEISLPMATTRRGAPETAAEPGGLPIRVGHADTDNPAVDQVRVEVLDRTVTERVNAHSVLLRVAPITAGRASTADAGANTVTVDYSAFRTAYGGGWASRLRLSLLPECALTTPDEPQCSAQPLPSRNDVTVFEVSAEVDLSATAGSGALLMLAASTAGAAGDFGATSLQPSSTWTAGGNSGAFTWSYPLRVPPAPGGPQPVVGLSYSSQAVDGRHAAANNQPSWVGGGFEGWPGGYIERRYKPCADDMGAGANNTTATGDLCWATDNAILNLNGTSGELLYNPTDGRWHLRSEDGSRIERKIGADNGDSGTPGANGDVGEHWVVTTAEGTQYWFGRHKLPGWTTNNPVTNSTWTAPVFGNHLNEPCRATTFAASSCQQAWRWNLDYVIDPHGNSMSYWYGRELNRYGRNNTATNAVEYTRGGHLNEIVYGTRQTSGVDGALAGTAPAKVVFAVADRCLANCATRDALRWPDTPWDQECTSSTSCAVYSPTFWTTKRLASITTQTRSGSGYSNVDRWTLTHSFPDPGDTTHAALWLTKISHQGLVGGAVTMPDITFTGLSMDNRVDGIDDIEAMAWFRIVRIDTETGGAIAVTYSERDCAAGGAKPAVHNNTKRCYPVRWTPPGQSAPITDWFHKYVVDELREVDDVAGNPQVLYRYSYLDGGAWHHTDDDGLIKPELKTWSDWRGYGRVGVTLGDPNSDDVRAYTETRYFRGMHGDRQPSGTRTVNVVDSKGGSWPDENWFAGMVRETITYNGVSGPEVSGEISDPWASAATATRTLNGDTVTARYTRVGSVRSRTALDAGRPDRVTRVNTTYDAYGMAVQVDDLGHDGVSGDERCIKREYGNRNTSAWIVDRVHRERTFAVACAAATNPNNLGDHQVVSDVRTFFDGATAHGTAPVRGTVTRTEEMSAWNAGSPSFVLASASGYDTAGRVTSVTNANNNTTTTAYSLTNGLVTATTVTNPLGHATTNTLNPAWGSVTKVVDPNNKITEVGYDPLGRLTGVWRPGRVKGTDSATATYSYNISSSQPSSVTSNTLNHAGLYVTSHTLYDGLLRQVQTQSPSPSEAGGRILTNTFYDTLGRAKKTYGSYYNSAAPSTNLVVPVEPMDVPQQHRTVFDGAGRVAAEVFEPYNAERWRTSYTYAGDRTNVTPPLGGTGKATVTDARGRTVEMWDYPRTAAWTTGSRTLYTHNAKGQMTKVTDPAGNEWTYTYDVRGRKVSETDPDRGTMYYDYDDGGRLTTTVDSRFAVLAFTYDELDRKTAVYEEFPAGIARANWVYDTVAKGMLSYSVRKLGSNTHTYKTEVTGYTNEYQPTGQKYTIPTAETGLAGEYEYAYAYNVDGSLSASTFVAPAATDLPTETLHYNYNSLGQPTKLTTTYGLNTYTYVHSSSYNALGWTDEHELCYSSCNTVGHKTELAYDYELDTGRLTQSYVGRDTAAPYTVSDVRYTYDHSGNITKAADLVSNDNQCFSHDHMRRLTSAWTPSNGNCGAAPSTSGLGGPAPYWLSWQYDVVGNRLQQVDHKSSGDVTTTYAYPAGGGSNAHRLSSSTTGSTTRSYTYDDMGNTLTRPTDSAGSQSLTWDLEGRLASTTDASGTTSYLYDADGSRLIRRDATGKTLYLPGQEVRYTTATGTREVTRYYAHGGQVVASRTAAGLVWLVADHQGTHQTAINATTHAVEQRRQTPFGTPRGAVPASWPNQKGFVGGDKDPTGLIHLGAREYDPGIGRFVSMDPVMDVTDSQQMHGYTYASNSPMTLSDPSGLYVTGDNEGNWKAYPKPSGGYDIDDQRVKVSPTYTNAGSNTGPSDDDVAKAKEIKETSVIEIVVREGGQFLLDLFGITEIMKCIDGDLMACGWALLDLIPWTKAVGLIRKADKFISAVTRVGRQLLKWRDNSKWADRVLAGASCPIPNSFVPGTRVVMAGGGSKPIEDLEVGEEVLATDPETGETAAKRVEAVITGDGDKELVDVSVATGGGDRSVITATDGHPFWVPELSEWVDAADLEVGQWLQTSAGTWVQITALERRTEATRVHNLTVADIHTYYVVAGDTPVLVHNCGIGDRSLDELHDLALMRNSKPGARNPGPSAAGRSIDKHAAPNRGSQQHARYKYGDTTPADRDWIGQTLVEEILTDPNSRRNLATSANGDAFLDIQMSNGIGARWGMEGGVERFVGFRVFDPY
ncbi:polymorphic toxin-type HINT domain-containing protein [Micromonospora sp. LOL_023]|uniref:polymorphic toxin-type HINT domain-containing protein n=1 Tax=Micromonospora sp. LOL_023 TaxID=3345418 RepID=UPI003A85699C